MVQQIVGTFLYFHQYLYFNILTETNSIAEQQAHPTQNTEAVITHLLDYAATNPDVLVKFWARYMTIHIYSDASYLLEPWERSHTVWQ